VSTCLVKKCVRFYEINKRNKEKGGREEVFPIPYSIYGLYKDRVRDKEQS
jgi:hypothetical protein